LVVRGPRRKVKRPPNARVPLQIARKFKDV